MKKKNKLFKSIGFGIASMCLLSGGAILFDGVQKIEQGENTYASSITNEVPAFFKTSNINDSSFYSFVDSEDGGSYTELFFDVETEEDFTGERSKFKGTYDNGTNFLVFGIDNINISMNGNNLESLDFTKLIHNYEEESYEKTTDTVVDENKTYYIQSGEDYIAVSTPTQSELVNYFEKRVATPYSLPVYPQALDVKFDIDLTQPNIVTNDNEIIFNEQGLVNISISYTIYETVETDINETKVLNVESTLAQQSFSYSFLLLDKGTYLENGLDENTPNFNYDDTAFTKTNSSMTGVKYNFFNNYSTNDIAKIEYNVKNFDLAILKADEQDNVVYNKISYDTQNATANIYDENGELVTDAIVGAKLDGENLSVYFYNVGEYTLSFSPIFINGNDVYPIEKELFNQKVYIFGLQSFYTISSGNYAELKTYDETHSTFTNSADQTYNIISNYSTIDDIKAAFNEINKVSSNRTPIKFRTLENVVLESSTTYFQAKDSDEWEEKTFSLLDNFMNPGKYIIKANYTYSSYENTSESFTQYFTFEIAKKPPEIEVYKFVETTQTDLADNAYVNSEVYLSFKDYANPYNKTVNVKLERYNFITGTTSEEYIDWTQNGINYTLSEDGTIKVTSDGNYKIYLERVDLQNPVTRTFNIDTVTEFNLNAYNVERSQISQNYYAGSQVDVLTNQPIVFSWDTVKASGATTSGTLKHYTIKTSDLYDDDGNFLANYINLFLDKDVIPVEYKLDLSSNEITWNGYSNFDYASNSNKSVSSEYIKSEAGLYIFQTYDIAGNTQTKVYIIDNSSPLFLSQSNSSYEYKLLNQYDTITEDSKILWSKYKALSIGKIDLTDDSLPLFKNRSNQIDNDIYLAFQEIISNKIISKLLLPYENDTYSGYYLTSEIDDDVYFKNYYTENYTFISGEESDYQYDIVTSYKLYAVDHEAGTFYRSTTAEDGMYLSVEGLIDPVYPNSSNVHEVQLYLYSPQTYIIYYNGVYRLYDATTDRLGNIISVENTDGVLSYNGTNLTEVEFVDKEGQYCFLIMDESNTNLSNRGKVERYLTYPSAFQYISITGDKSKLSVSFKSGDRSISLADSSIVNINEIKDERDNILGLSKTAYFLPTNENVLYVSFVPTTEDNGKVIQVEKVTVTYYEFENSNNLYFDRENDRLMNYNEYKNLSTEKTFETDIYSYSNDGASTSTLEYELNINDEITSAGYYVITRTYLTNETKAESDPNDYLVAQYDYYSRTLNSYVDRYNVLTQTETISYTYSSYEFKITTQDETEYTLTYHVFGNTVYIPMNENDSVVVKANDGSSMNAQLTISGTLIDNYPGRIYSTSASGQRYTVVTVENFNTDLISSNITGTKTSSPIENPETFTSTQSLIGGSMLVTMYSKYSRNNASSIISISHPGQTSNSNGVGLVTYNSGDSFYTRQNTTNLGELSTIFNTNKLPVSIWIPKYKYVTYYRNEMKDNDADNTRYVYHYAYETDKLSYYDSKNSISSYELEVRVDYYENGMNETQTPTKVYKSNGDLIFDIAAGNTGYLALYNFNPSTGAYEGLAENFYKAGAYYVTVTQAPKEVSSSAYNFKNSYSFLFNIEENKPQFDLYSGTLLKSVSDTTFYEDNSSLSNTSTYFTNKDEISVVWADSASVYKSNIDKTNIILTSNSQNNILSIENNTVKLNGNVSNKFTYDFNETTLTNTLTFKLSDLGITNNNSSLTITMQFVGHDSQYYSTTSKTIFLDKQADFQMVEGLFANVSNDKNKLSLTELREYYLADGVTQTTNKDIASYNQTISSGIYQNYAYAVKADFFEQLKAYIKNNIDENVHYKTTSAYFTEIQLASYNPTSNTYDFVETENTKQIKDTTTFDEIKEGTYYEVVERDLAGNITIYVVYVVNTNDTYLDGVGEIMSRGLHYNTENVVKTSEINSGKYEIYANSNFELTSIDYQADQWNYFYIMTYNPSLGGYQTNSYLQTPDIEEGYVYRVSGTQTKSYTKVALSSLLANQNGLYKSKIYVLDRTNGTYNLVTTSISDTAILSLEVTGTSNSAMLSIALPSNALNNDLYVSAKPISVSVKIGENEVYSITNDPNKNLSNEDYTYIANFTNSSNDYAVVTYDNSTLRFSLSNLARDTRVTFSVTDCFGITYSEIYLVGETRVDEILSNGNLYSYNALLDEEYTTVYITSDDVVFSYNTKKYTPKFFLDGVQITASQYGISADKVFYIEHTESGSIGSYIFASNKYQYDVLIKIALYDASIEENPPEIKSYYIRLYQKLPYKTDDSSTPDDYFITLTNSNGIDDTEELIKPKRAIEEDEYITVNGKSYLVYSSTQTFSDEIKVTYRLPSLLDFPYEVQYISFEDFWTNGNNFVPLESGTKLDNNGVYYILVSYTSSTVLTNEYYLFKLDILGSTGEHYYILADGVRREKANVYYKDGTTESSAYYIVNINYQDRSITEKFQIMTNNYQQVKSYELPNAVFEGPGIYTYKYLITNYKNVNIDAQYYGEAPETEGIIPYQQIIYVTFLNPTNDILSVLTGSTSYLSYRTNDTAEMFVTSSTKEVKVIIYDDTTGTDSMSIFWAKSYGIDSNEIDLILEKDGRKVSVTKKSSGNYFYTTLTRSGSYNIRFVDTALNVQSFNSGMTSLPLIFIKDAHFTVSYVNPVTEEEIETEVINKAVYNSTVKLKLNKLLVPYYQTSYFGSGDIITALRNGQEYKDYVYSSQDYSFTFSELGYYEVYMTAYNQSATTSKQIRTEKYSFSIISSKESRYAYNFSGYQNYYIKSIVKNGVDVTSALFKSLKTSSNTITVDNESYLRNILISYFDQKTGSGRYQITICANDMLYLNNNEEMACFTFEFFINSNPVPLVVSTPEGSATSKNVSVKFNAKNIYDSVGECYVVVGKETYHIDETTTETVELILGDNESRGDHYIEVRTMSGNLLYSYKVTLTEPMNAWSIIAIIAGSIVAIAVIFIIIKLRKRMGVK